MGLFTKTPEQTPVQKINDLQGESAAIVGLITNTIQDLQSVNEKIAREKDAVSEEINKLIQVRDSAGMQMEQNASIAGKLNSFLND